jgi:hypothetical protein
MCYSSVNGFLLGDWFYYTKIRGVILKATCYLCLQLKRITVNYMNLVGLVCASFYYVVFFAAISDFQLVVSDTALLCSVTSLQSLCCFFRKYSRGYCAVRHEILSSCECSCVYKQSFID